MGYARKPRPCKICGKEIASTRSKAAKFCKKCYETRDKERHKIWLKNNKERINEIRRKYRAKKRAEAKKAVKE